MSQDGVAAAYDRLLASVGARADAIGSRPVVTHWPHVGSAYDGLVILGQALYGWPDDFTATQFQTPEGWAEAIRVSRVRSDRIEPLDWIATHPVRSSPFWRVARMVAEALEPATESPWYSRFAHVNLYPAAPDAPPGNPIGPLREAQDHFVGELLAKTMDMMDAKRVIALVGPFWWPAGSSGALGTLAEEPRPLLRSGRLAGRTWVVGWRPGGANRRGWGSRAYAALIVSRVLTLEQSDPYRGAPPGQRAG